MCLSVCSVTLLFTVLGSKDLTCRLRYRATSATTVVLLVFCTWAVDFLILFLLQLCTSKIVVVEKVEAQ